MMTGGSLDHSTIASNLMGRPYSDKLRGDGLSGIPRRCQSHIAKTRSMRYPDLSITCSPVHRPGRYRARTRSSSSRSSRRAPSARGSRAEKVRLFRYPVDPAIRHHRTGRAADRPLHAHRSRMARRDRHRRRGATNLSAIRRPEHFRSDAIYEDTRLDATRRRADETPSSGGVKSRIMRYSLTASPPRTLADARRDRSWLMMIPRPPRRLRRASPRPTDRRSASGHSSCAPAVCSPVCAGAKTEGAVLDRACAQQHLPMRLPGRHGEYRRHRQEIGCRACASIAVEVRESAPRHSTRSCAEPAPRRLGDDAAACPGGRR